MEVNASGYLRELNFFRFDIDGNFVDLFIIATVR